MKVLTILLATLAVSLLLVGCKTTDKNSAPAPLTKAVFYNKMDDKVGETTDAKQLAGMYEAWQNKERVLEKIMPLFDYSIKVDVNGQAKVWKYTKAGYFMEKNDSKLYKITTPEVFNRNIKD